MQCLWYLMEEGDAYRRAGNLPAAVKRYEQVVAVSSFHQSIDSPVYELFLKSRLSKNLKTTITISTLTLSESLL
jgi:hypothetical protein